jgi:hypothetical protein
MWNRCTGGIDDGATDGTAIEGIDTLRMGSPYQNREKYDHDHPAHPSSCACGLPSPSLDYPLSTHITVSWKFAVLSFRTSKDMFFFTG